MGSSSVIQFRVQLEDLIFLNNYNMFDIPSGYFPVVVIPGGASGLVFSEAAITPNYLAVRDIYGKYYLNGNWQMMSEGVYEIAGTKFIYQRNYREPERLTAEGPTMQDIVLEVREEEVFQLCQPIFFQVCQPIFINYHCY